MIIPLKVEPSEIEISTLFNLGNMLKEFIPDWNVSFTHCMVPYDLRSFFLQGSVFTRASYNMRKFDKGLFIHVDFKTPIEIYIIHQISSENVSRRVYSIDRTDSLALFRIITSELESNLNGDLKGS